MGKSKRKKGSQVGGDPVENPGTLADQILYNKDVRAPGRSKTRDRKDQDQEYVDEKLSKKILQQAKLQQAELEEDVGVSSGRKKNSKDPKVPRAISLGAGPSHESDDEEDDYEQEEADYENIEVDEEDEKALEMFMSKNPPVRRTLADIIMEKITEKQTEIQTQLSDNASVQMQRVDERVVKMYRNVRDILSKYRSGKLPKAFKIIPSLSNWEQILYLTEPDKWSAAAMCQATRIFSSNLNAKMAQRFFNLVLLPRVQDDISEFKRLNFHLYMAVKKSLFKPAAFFKGILLPLCESGTCTLREAIIISSIMTKSSIPMLHSAAAILKIAEMDYNGANSIFLRTLLDKKYALPFRVVDAMVAHFVRFTTDKRELPVLWHQSLLTFVQRYKEDISSEQKEALMDLLRVQIHPQITPEIRREITHSSTRDLEDAVPPDTVMDSD